MMAALDPPEHLADILREILALAGKKDMSATADLKADHFNPGPDTDTEMEGNPKGETSFTH